MLFTPADITLNFTLFEFEFDEFDDGSTGVLHRPRLSSVLPSEISAVRSHATIGRAGHDFVEYAAADVDSESRRRLRELSSRFFWLQNDTPSSYALVIQDLSVAGDSRAVGN